MSDKEKGIKYDPKKVNFSLIPPTIERALASVLTYGAGKYEPYNWQKVENFRERFYSALRRHLDSWWDGEDYDLDDEDSGERGAYFLHSAQVLCNAMFLLWYDLHVKKLKLRLNNEEIKEISKQKS